MPSRLSETMHGAAWLDNFQIEDVGLARQLLDFLTIVAWSEARAALLALVKQELESGDGPIWLLPLMAREDIAVVSSVSSSTRLVPFENYAPGRVIEALPGSEGAIGNMLRDLIDGVRVLRPDTPLEDLQSTRVRRAVIVTDLVATGTQVERYIETLIANRTLKSWVSFGWLKISIVAYAVSSSAQDRFGSRSIPLSFVITEPTIDSLPWPSARKRAAKILCENYPSRGAGLGYKGHGGLFAFQESIPNTLPNMFRHMGDGWASLFDGRLLPPAFQSELHPVQTPTLDLRAVISDDGQVRLATSLARQMRPENKQILALLSGFLRSSPSIAQAEQILQVRRSEANRIVDFMVSCGWLDAQLRVTTLGRTELDAGKSKERGVPHKELGPFASDPYYPRSLR